MPHSSPPADVAATPASQLPQPLPPLPQYVALIPAAGVGARMGGSIPKQYLQLTGKSVLQHTVEAFLATPIIDQVFVVVSGDDAYVEELLLAKVEHRRLHILRCGGATRQKSVNNGLQQIAQQMQIRSNDWVLVHDAARPGITPALIQKLITQVGQHEVGGLLALPVVDTVKRVSADAVEQVKVSTVARAGLWLAQTPQMFRYQLLCDALQQANEVTDEASAIEAMGLSPRLVEGHPRNNKLTRPDDLALIQFYLNNE